MDLISQYKYIKNTVMFGEVYFLSEKGKRNMKMQADTQPKTHK